MKSNVKFEKIKQTKIHSIKFYFLEARLFAGIFSRTTTVHPGIFLVRALWADRVSNGLVQYGVAAKFLHLASQESVGGR